MHAVVVAVSQGRQAMHAVVVAARQGRQAMYAVVVAVSQGRQAMHAVVVAVRQGRQAMHAIGSHGCWLQAQQYVRFGCIRALSFSLSLPPPPTTHIEHRTSFHCEMGLYIGAVWRKTNFHSSVHWVYSSSSECLITDLNANESAASGVDCPTTNVCAFRVRVRCRRPNKSRVRAICPTLHAYLPRCC
jgi:hypothetical protein